MKYRGTISVLLLWSASNPALAAGFGLHEFSAQAMGTAFAGSAASTGDAGFLAYNPASSSGVIALDGTTTAVGILTSSSANYATALTSAGTPAGGNARPSAFVGGSIAPAADVRIRLSDRLTAGLSINTPWDLATNYQPDFAGRYYAEQSKLLTADFTPSLSYEILDGVHLAVGVQIEYAKGTLSNAVDLGTIGALLKVPGSVPGAMDATATLTAVNWSAGYSFGAMARLSDDLVLGASYNSAVSHDFNGMLRFQADVAGLMNAISAATGLFKNSPAATKITMPDVLRTSARYRFAPGWEASFEADWTGWKKFNTLNIISANASQPPDITAANWKSTWMFALGAQYHGSDAWTYRAGVAMDPTPVPDATLGPRIPDGDRTVLSFGASYALDAADTITVAASHLFVASGNVSLLPTQTGNALRGALAGTTNASANVVGLQFSRIFDGLSG
jgi:long-chain fatty acid transport protein